MPCRDSTGQFASCGTRGFSGFGASAAAHATRVAEIAAIAAGMAKALPERGDDIGTLVHHYRLLAATGAQLREAAALVPYGHQQSVMRTVNKLDEAAGRYAVAIRRGCRG